MGERILAVRGLKTHYYIGGRVIKAVDGLEFDLERGETLGIVGESGCGKSTAALSVMGLIPLRAGRVVGGQVLFKGKSLLALPGEEMRRIRGSEMSMIFQEPMTSLNPVLTIGRQVSEVFMVHKGMSRREALDEAVKILSQVGIPAPEQMIREYPHRLSGGMRQRAMIAMAIACGPDVLIADEPTSELDVTVQDQVLRLLRELKERIGMAMVLITHDLGVVAETVQNVLVMYAGRAVEYSDVSGLFNEPMHPYTKGLIASVPGLGMAGEKLGGIKGEPPSPLDLPGGCSFHPRCEHAREICRIHEPELVRVGDGRLCACHLYNDW
ncbi:MAG TPA: ABC transporter ATP-binding protein [Bacillota bacterium]|nr:ABC transporter ATP-binding protein [Bacillota bacterium]